MASSILLWRFVASVLWMPFKVFYPLIHLFARPDVLHMGATKNYVLKLAELGDTLEQQDAIEWAIFSGWIPLAYELENDRALIRDQLPTIVEQFRRLNQKTPTTPVPCADLMSGPDDSL